MKRINFNNVGQNGYPLFLGDKLGLFENTTITQPQIAFLRDKEVEAFWVWTEFDKKKDALDIQNEKFKAENFILSETLMFQMFGDKEASSVKTVLEPVVSNNELASELSYRGWNETVHDYGYGDIVTVAYADSKKMLLAIKDNPRVLKRATFYSNIMDDTYFRIVKWVHDGYPEEDKRELREYILKYIVALYLLEAISFKASFACTFAVTKSTKGHFNGISSTVAYIARDEIIHSEVDRVILRELRKESQEWRDVFDKLKPWMLETINTLIEQEYEWADYLFSEGRNITDLNANLLKKYIDYHSKIVYDALGLSEYSKPCGKKDPLPWINSEFLKLDNIQFAGQEIATENYQKSSIKKDNKDVTYDF